MTAALTIMRLPVILAVVAAVASGCSGGASPVRPVEWEPATGVYSIPYNGLAYDAGSGNTFIMAPPESLPEGMDMCGLDTVGNACVTILNAAVTAGLDGKVSSCSEYDIGVMARDIAGGNDSAEVIRGLDVSRDVFLGRNVWRFRLMKYVVDNGDTIGASYTGYVFDALKDAAVIVLTLPASVEADSLTVLEDKYLHNLKMTE